MGLCGGVLVPTFPKIPRTDFFRLGIQSTYFVIANSTAAAWRYVRKARYLSCSTNPRVLGWGNSLRSRSATVCARCLGQCYNNSRVSLDPFFLILQPDRFHRLDRRRHLVFAFCFFNLVPAALKLPGPCLFFFFFLFEKRIEILFFFEKREAQMRIQ